ncbi:protein kinase [Pirellulales bacterium]|nr:protein kinase [Pirellulales bacterium]
MSTSPSQFDLPTDSPEIARQVNELSERLQAGESIDLQSFCADFPEHLEQLEMLLPTLEAVVELEHAVSNHRSAASVQPGLPNAPLQGVLGDFRIVREIGRGGMGVVYEAEQVSVGRRVALKVLPFAAMLKSQQLERFRNEVRAAGSLNHPNIVTVHAVGSERSVHFYAMEFIEGQSLADVIAESSESAVDRNSGEPLENRVAHAETLPVARLSTLRTSVPNEFFRAVAKLGRQAAEALEHAHHRGVVHRDVKPANLLAGDDQHLWVADFGLARLETDAGMTMSGELLGTLRYMSPEQAAGDHSILDHRTDVYSLGATLYELLAARPAFASSDRHQLLHDVRTTSPVQLRKLNVQIPADLETIISKAMEKDPADRYRTAAAMASDLQNFIDHRPIAARPPSFAAQVRKWARRRPRVVSAAFLALLLATLGSVVAAVLVAGANQRTQLQNTRAEANLRVALETIDKLLIRVGQDATAHGKLDHADDLVREAVQSYDALLTDSDDPQVVLKAASAHNQLAGILQLEAQFREAEAAADQGLELLKRLSDDAFEEDGARQIRASLLGASGLAKLSLHNYVAAEWFLRDALALYEELCTSAPADLTHRKHLLLAHNNLGTVLMYAGQLDEAEREYRAAETLRHTLPAAEQEQPLGLNQQAGLKTNLATMAVTRGNYKAAEADFRSAIEAQHRAVAGLPQDPSMREDLYKFRWNLADVLVRSGQYDAAVNEIASISEEFPERLQAHVEGVWLLARCVELGEESRHQDYLDLARSLMERTERASFAPKSVQQEMAWLLATCPVAELRDGQRAVKIAQRLCNQEPSNDEYQHALSAAHFELGEFDSAYAAAEKTRKLDCGSAYSYALLALTQAARGENEDALQWREKAMRVFESVEDIDDAGLRSLFAILEPSEGD